MKKLTKQCFLTFSLLLSTLLSGCLNPFYEKVSDIVDSYLAEQKVQRMCAVNFVEMYNLLSHLKNKIGNIPKEYSSMNVVNAGEDYINMVLKKSVIVFPISIGEDFWYSM